MGSGARQSLGVGELDVVAGLRGLVGSVAPGWGDCDGLAGEDESPFRADPATPSKYSLLDPRRSATPRANAAQKESMNQ